MLRDEKCEFQSIEKGKHAIVPFSNNEMPSFRNMVSKRYRDGVEPLRNVAWVNGIAMTPGKHRG